MLHGGILGRDTSFEQRFFTDFEKVKNVIDAVKKLNQKVVLTSGTWDMLHIGHVEYLERARELGDFLVVGVDSDEKVSSRKGPNRPIVPEMERSLLLAHTRHPDMVVLKPLSEKPRELLKIVRPDILVVSETTGHEDGAIDDMKKYCGEVRVLKPQAQTSTTARIRLLAIGGLEEFTTNLQKAIPDIMQQTLTGISGGKISKEES